MKIEKLPSGSYRVRQQVNGKRYSVVVDHKPSNREATLLIAEKLSTGADISAKGDFRSYAKKYLDSNLNILSPRTVDSYDSILRNLSDTFLDMQILDIDTNAVQNEINRYSPGRSPKTVSNAYGFISRVLSVYRPNLKLRCNLPQREEVETYVPTKEEAQAIIAAATGTRYEIPLRLGCYGLRRSETCALVYPDDLEGNILHVNKALVYNQRKCEWVVKVNKTTQSRRDIYLSDALVQLIHDNGKFYTGSPEAILRALHRYQDQLGIRRFRLHDLRGYFATELHQNGVVEADILKLGGWSKKNSDVMKIAYRHARIQQDLDAMKNASDALDF
jgi:integrase